MRWGEGGVAWALALALEALAMAGLASTAVAQTAPAQPAGHITGLGGVFVTSKDPKALATWYRDVLGVPLEPWGGATLRYDAPGHPPVVVWNAVRQGSSYLAPSQREFMLDFAVDDLDAFVARLQAKGVPILKRDDSDPSGRFAWIVDPDGTKIELWQAKRP
ncbi:VOC family protein [Caulobacter sp. KR2-114]|uniref:VOC family protein n=1 Tax=Caulobacter sp. KR2-114 TaxID=3400912 RepID=UPI003C065CE3